MYNSKLGIVTFVRCCACNNQTSAKSSICICKVTREVCEIFPHIWWKRIKTLNIIHLLSLKVCVLEIPVTIPVTLTYTNVYKKMYDDLTSWRESFWLGLLWYQYTLVSALISSLFIHEMQVSFIGFPSTASVSEVASTHTGLHSCTGCKNREMNVLSMGWTAQSNIIMLRLLTYHCTLHCSAHFYSDTSTLQHERSFIVINQSLQNSSCYR